MYVSIPLYLQSAFPCNQAGSSLDPSFWPMHPTMERLFMFSVLTGHTTDMTWPDSGDSATDIMVSRYGDTCNGHGGSDVFPFGLLDTDTDGWSVRKKRRAALGSSPQENRNF